MMEEQEALEGLVEVETLEHLEVVLEQQVQPIREVVVEADHLQRREFLLMLLAQAAPVSLS